MTLVQSEIAIFRKSDGALDSLAPAALKPADPALGWVALPAGFSEATFTWNATSRTMVESPAKIEAQLLAAIKAEAERRKMTVLSPGGAKKTEYADKAGEVRQMKTLGGTVTAALAAVAVLSTSRQASLFPYAAADAAAFGDTVVDAFNRFMGGMTSSASVPAIAAAEAKTCAAIKAATTAAAKRTAAAAVAWP